MKKIPWRNLVVEFLSVFIAVVSAFGLNNWNDNRRDHESQDKILREIHNGLQLDLQDIETNRMGHRLGIQASQYFRKVVQGDSVAHDSLGIYYIMVVRDFTSIMNLSGYQSLKSKGLEIIENDSIRLQILALYDYYYQIMYKLEETAVEMQSFQNYFAPINEALAPYMIYDGRGNLVGLSQPIPYSDTERKRLLSYLWRIETNRMYKLQRYGMVEEQVRVLKNRLAEELELETL